MFLDSSEFPFCMDWNLVQCLFTNHWIILWWWLYVAVLIIGLSDHGLLCVFFRKYMCGVDVLEGLWWHF